MSDIIRAVFTLYGNINVTFRAPRIIFIDCFDGSVKLFYTSRTPLGSNVSFVLKVLT